MRKFCLSLSQRIYTQNYKEKVDHDFESQVRSYFLNSLGNAIHYEF